MSIYSQVQMAIYLSDLCVASHLPCMAKNVGCVGRRTGEGSLLEVAAESK